MWATPVKTVRVTQAEGGSLNNMWVDEILEDMSEVLVNDSAGGQPCRGLTFVRDGDVATEPTLRPFINTETELDALLADTSRSVRARNSQRPYSCPECMAMPPDTPPPAARGRAVTVSSPSSRESADGRRSPFPNPPGEL